MVKYDEKIIAEMADRWYSWATMLVASFTFVGFLSGAFFALAYVAYRNAQLVSFGWSGFVLGFRSWSSLIPEPQFVGASLVGGSIGGVIGFLQGTKAALSLRFRAQQVLVLVEIERNTRRRA